MARHYTLDSFWAGAVVCDIGQITPELKRQFEKLVRSGDAVKWRGYWHPVAGASFGIGPLKTCYGLASKYVKASA